jgi:hypothetical protein
VRRLIAIVLAVGFAVAFSARWSIARARTTRSCPPAARLTGDAELIDAVAAVLAERGVAPAEGGECPSIDVDLRREGTAMIVSAGPGDGPPVRRAVSDVRTAATVIESWVRTDVEAPLLAGPASAAAWAASEPDAAAPASARAAVGSLAPTVAAVAAGAPDARRVQVFTIAETSLASDRTSWVGAQIGACVMLGPLCASARARFATVAGGPGPWQSSLDRRGVELLLGADLPLRLGAATLSPGAALGVGWIHTHEEAARHVEGETGGLRAEAHLALSFPIRSRLAVELALSLDVTQATHVETSLPEVLPDEPRLLGRLGAGVRFGGL